MIHLTLQDVIYYVDGNQYCTLSQTNSVRPIYPSHVLWLCVSASVHLVVRVSVAQTPSHG